MKFFPAVFLSFWFVSNIGIVHAGDEVSINAGLQANAGGSYSIPAGVHIIESQITVPPGTTLQGTVGSNGESLTTLKIADNVDWDAFVPMIIASSNTKILHIKFDGNSNNQNKVPLWHGHNGKESGKRWGQGYHNIIKFDHQNGLEVAYCDFGNNLGDGVRVINSASIDIHHNTAWKLGHDAFFIIRSEGARIHDNNVQPRVNSAIRLMDVNHARIYKNYINYVRYYEGVSYDAGPDVQIQHDSGIMKDIEVCNNVVLNSCGPGLWLVGHPSEDEDLWLHHNLFMNCGSNHGISWVGGIIASGYDGALIEKNVFDGSYLGGICFYAVSSSMGTKATTTINANILTNSIPGTYSGAGGYGIYNAISQQSSISTQNCYWNNKAGNTYGASTSATDLFIDPKSNPTPSGWTWDGQTWICPEVNPREMGEIPVGPDGSNVYRDQDPITEEDIQEFDDFLDLFKVKLHEQAINSNSTPKVNIKSDTQGIIKGGVKIAGFNRMIKLDGEYYIKSPEDVIVVTEAENLANNPVSIDKIVTLKAGNGTLTADLEIRAKYKVAKIQHKVRYGIPVTTIKYIEKSQTAHCTDTEPMPKIFNGSGAGTVHIKIMNQSINPQTRVYAAPNLDTVKISFKYNGTEAVNTLRIGLIEKSKNNVQYVNMTKADVWEKAEGTGHVGNTFVIPEALDPYKAADQITVMYYDVYGNQTEAEKYNVTEITSSGDLTGYVNPVAILLAIVFGTLGYATFKNFWMVIKR